MAAIKFLTRTQSKRKRTVPLYLRLSEGKSIDLWVKLPSLVNPANWSNKTGKFKQNLKEPLPEVREENELAEIKLESLNKAVLKAMNNTSKRDREWLEGVVADFYNPQSAGATTLTEYISKYINDASSGIKLTFHGSKRFSSSTLKSIRSFRTEFEKYQSELKEKIAAKKTISYRPKSFPIDFEDVNIDFYHDFVKYFNGKHYSPNTVGKHVKTLKTILKEAKDNGVNNTLDFERKAFKATNSPVESIYLDETELRKMYDLDLSSKPDLAIARDIFLIGSWTCQRFSDYSRINKITKLESGAKVIRLTQVKTGTKVTVPVKPELYTILQRYEVSENEIQLPKIWQQQLNERIKLVGKLAKIDELIEIKKVQGGLAVISKFQKFMLITSHTARRSGCSNLFNAGVPSLFIMALSGHKTEREFMKYLKLTEDDIALTLSKNPYFAGNMKIVG